MNKKAWEILKPFKFEITVAFNKINLISNKTDCKQA